MVFIWLLPKLWFYYCSTVIVKFVKLEVSLSCGDKVKRLWETIYLSNNIFVIILHKPLHTAHNDHLQSILLRKSVKELELNRPNLSYKKFIENFESFSNKIRSCPKIGLLILFTLLFLNLYILVDQIVRLSRLVSRLEKNK